jgi:pilus assembly protein Flp/PilA
MTNLFARFLRDESAATAIEYGLIAAGIALAIIAVVNGLGTTLNDKFSSINSSLK